MDLDSASLAFEQLMSSVKKEDAEKFCMWVKGVVNDQLEEIRNEDNASVLLNSIRDDIRDSLPVEATSQTEQFVQPTIGQNADCDARTTLHVDAFLYDEEAIDELVDEGKMSRNYCVQCLSRSVKPLTFITHSASVPQIQFMFQSLLGDLRGKTVLDVGSRTGAVLYGAHLYSAAQAIIGVEIDSSFCQLQQGIIHKYNMMDRIKIIHSDVLQQGELLRSSDVVILNNVFEFFMTVDQQLVLWKFIYENVRKPGAVLITIPRLEDTLSNLNATLDFNAWLSPVDVDQQRATAALKYFAEPDDSDLGDIHMYTVR